jgi:hypothetical protein
MMKIAQVTQVYPESRTVDIVFLESRLACAGVNVMSGSIGTDHGVWDLAAVKKPAESGQVGALSSSSRNLLAVCGFTGPRAERPIVMGFLRPADSVLVFTEDNREVHLHPSGTYTTIAPDGSHETWTAGGGYVRIGTGGHQDLASVAAKGWPAPSGAPVPTITASNGKGTAIIDPDGNMSISLEGNLAATVAGDMTASVTGTAHIASEGGVTVSSTVSIALQAPDVAVDGNLSVSGELTATGGITGD